MAHEGGATLFEAELTKTSWKSPKETLGRISGTISWLSSSRLDGGYDHGRYARSAEEWKRHLVFGAAGCRVLPGQMSGSLPEKNPAQPKTQIEQVVRPELTAPLRMAANA